MTPSSGPDEMRNIMLSILDVGGPDGSTVCLSAACRWGNRAYFSSSVDIDDKIAHYIKHVSF